MNQGKGLAAAVGDAQGRLGSRRRSFTRPTGPCAKANGGSKIWPKLLPQAVYEMDLQGRLTFVNRQALETFGYTQAEFEAGLSCFQMLALQEQNRVRENIQRTVDGQDLGEISTRPGAKMERSFPRSSSVRRSATKDTPVGLRGSSSTSAIINGRRRLTDVWL